MLRFVQAANKTHLRGRDRYNECVQRKFALVDCVRALDLRAALDVVTECVN